MQASTGKILIVDDEFSVRDSLFHWFRKDGHQVFASENATEALRRIQDERFDVILLDIKMPGMDGIELQKRIHAVDPEVAIIMITAYASVDTAVRAMKQGAFDYVSKPIDPDELSHLVFRALERRRLTQENTQLKERLAELSGVDSIVGESPQMQEIMEQIRSVAPSDATVLIRGESGTGKDLIAKAVHANSQRRYSPIVTVNCGALPDELLESELFGHEKGAFTGAQYRRKGRLEMADGGTLFLDEIGTISPKTQVDLLRVLETKEFTRLGSNKSIQVDFRVICATNEDLEQAVRDKRFREDLYYRINVFSITAPPLRERLGDIKILAQHFMEKYAQQMDKQISAIAPDAMEALLRHDWPGNVRELANAMERAVVTARNTSIHSEDLPFWPRAQPRSSIGDSLAELEEKHIAAILEKHQWNIKRAAEVLGIDRTTLYNKIKKYGLRNC